MPGCRPPRADVFPGLKGIFMLTLGRCQSGQTARAPGLWVESREEAGPQLSPRTHQTLEGHNGTLPPGTCKSQRNGVPTPSPTDPSPTHGLHPEPGRHQAPCPSLPLSPLAQARVFLAPFIPSFNEYLLGT